MSDHHYPHHNKCCDPCDKRMQGEQGPQGIPGLNGEDREDVDPKELENLKKEIGVLKNRPLGRVGGFKAIRFAKFSFTGDGSTTAFTLPSEPGGKGLGIWIYSNGGWLQPGVHFNIAGKTLTTTYTPANGEPIVGFLLVF